MKAAADATPRTTGRRRPGAPTGLPPPGNTPWGSTGPPPPPQTGCRPRDPSRWVAQRPAPWLPWNRQAKFNSRTAGGYKMVVSAETLPHRDNPRNPWRTFSSTPGRTRHAASRRPWSGTGHGPEVANTLPRPVMDLGLGSGGRSFGIVGLSDRMAAFGATFRSGAWTVPGWSVPCRRPAPLVRTVRHRTRFPRPRGNREVASPNVVKGPMSTVPPRHTVGSTSDR